MGQWNAYESWLGLSLGGRAPTHYELLGLPPGAPQPAALRQAVLQRMAKVRPYQTGQHGEAATRLLNELAEAAVVLGDPRRRAAYDASLAGQKLTQEQTNALETSDWWESGGSLVDPFLEQLVGEMQQQTSPLLLQPRPASRSSAWVWGGLGAAGLAILLLFVLLADFGGDRPGGPGEPSISEDPSRPALPAGILTDVSRFHLRITPPEEATWIIRPGRLGGADWNYWMDGGVDAPDPLQTGVGRTPFLDGQIDAVSGGTPWPTRRLQTSLRFRLPSLAQRRVVLCVLYDANLIVAVNGRSVLGCPDVGLVYQEIELTAEEQAAFREGENEIVASCDGDGLAEWPDVFDLGLRLVEDASDKPPESVRPPLLAYPATPAECQTAQQKWADFLQMPVQLRSGIAGLELALIPAGQFWMGSPEWEAGRNADVETPAATTLTRPFYLGATEVTRAQWRTVMDIDPEEWREPGTTARWPVTYVSWQDAEKFCELLTQREREMGFLRADWSYALPTEAQWEFACRSGSVGRFCCGENVELLKKFDFFAGGWRRGVQEVGQLQSNAYGLFDMHGNAQEWCRDWHTQRLPGGVDPYQAASGGEAGRSVRGGTAGMGVQHVRAARRNWSWSPPDYGDFHTGFRVALVPDATAIPGPPSAQIPALPPLTPAQAADVSRTCAYVADDPTHSRWLIRPGELGGCFWSFKMSFGDDASGLPVSGTNGSPFASPTAVGQTMWNTPVLQAWLSEVHVPDLAAHRLVLRVRHSGALVVQVNARDLLHVAAGVSGYVDHWLTPEQQAVFQPGQNGIAISCFGGPSSADAHFFDLGLRLVREEAGAEGGVSVAPPVAEPPTEATYLSDLPFVEPNNSWGPIERDLSNGDNAAGDGRPLTLQGMTYAKGLGVHAPSSVTFNLNGEYDRFQAFVGLDEEVGLPGSVVFQVYGDRMLLYDSGRLDPLSETHHVDVSVQGVQQLLLVVRDGGDGYHSDHADWADAKLLPAAD